MRTSFKICSLFFIFPLIVLKLFAQDNTCSISFTIDSATAIKVKNLDIRLKQEEYLILCKLHEAVVVKKDVKMMIEFESPDFMIPGFKNLKVYRDTVIEISPRYMDELVLESKKRIIKQTLKGFEYSPANDSLFKGESLLVSLQRLPFTVLQGADQISFGERKVLYKINGREKKGLVNNWSNILKALKAKDIYKIEMLAEVPEYVKNQGYDIIINILTQEANLYGKSFMAATIYNSRKQVQPNFRYTQQHKRSDFSVDFSSRNDQYVSLINSSVYEKSSLIYESQIQSQYKYYNYASELGYGLRIDSANDFSITASLHRYESDQIFTTVYSYPNIVNNQHNNLTTTGGEINMSLVHRKNKYITQSLSVKINRDIQDFNNRYAYIEPLQSDSINHRNKNVPVYWIVEYNYLNSKNKTYNVEYGLQMYNKEINQSYYIYSINAANNEIFYRLYSSEDTLGVSQYAIRPYFRYDKDFSDKRNLILNLYAEYYSIKSNAMSQRNYLLPGVTIDYKTLFKNNHSIKYGLAFYFSKPAQYFFTGELYRNTPAETYAGTDKLTPGKGFWGSIEHAIAGKATFSQELSAGYSFGIPSFFARYDSNKNLMITSPDNGQDNFSLMYGIYFKKLWWKKVDFSFYSRISYISSINEVQHSSYQGVEYRMQPSLNYSIGPKYGMCGLSAIIDGNKISSQGTQSIPLRYFVYYSKPFFKRKIVLSVSANEFFKKNKVILSHKVFQNMEQYYQNTSPNRVFSIRVAYHFSNIKLSKFAQKKSTSIKGEN